MGKVVGVTPSWSGAWALWAGSDHYSLSQALRREPFMLPLDRVAKVYRIHAKPLIGLGGGAKFAIEYSSELRECFVTLEYLPEELEKREREVITPPGAALLFFRHSWREPTALLLPFFIPFFTMIMILALGLWNEHVLMNAYVQAFFANPGCDAECVSKVLLIHSVVGFFFFVPPLVMLLLPIGLLRFQAPRYRSALNYRMVQSYSMVSMVVGVCLMAFLMAGFPFQQYGRFLELGFDPKVERLLSNLKSK